MEIATPLLGLAMTVVFGGWFLFDRVRQFCQTVLRSAGDGVPCGVISKNIAFTGILLRVLTRPGPADKMEPSEQIRRRFP